MSAWHPFLVWDGSKIVEKRADALQCGDSVIGPNASSVAVLPTCTFAVEYNTEYFRKEENNQVVIDPDLAWLCGYFMGDGSLGAVNRSTTNNYGRTYTYAGLRLRFHDETLETLAKVQRLMLQYFGEGEAAIQEDGRG